jgi:hypothetical protein
MRCPDCNKFVSYNDEDEIEVQSEEATYDKEDRTVQVQIEVRIAKTCGECGTELKEATIEIDKTIENVDESEAGDGDFEIDTELSSDSWSKGHGRWTETFYGVSGTITVKRPDEDRKKPALWSSEITIEVKDACVAASGMDELV